MKRREGGGREGGEGKGGGAAAAAVAQQGNGGTTEGQLTGHDGAQEEDDGDGNVGPLHRHLLHDGAHAHRQRDAEHLG